jgi:hypothetical protein
MTVVSGGLGIGGVGGATTEVKVQDKLRLKLQRRVSQPPFDYPPIAGATEVWKWGLATGDYVSEVQRDTYKAGQIGALDISYGLPGPAGTDMSALWWKNNNPAVSHHTSPDTVGGQTAAAVNPNMKPGTSNFKFYFAMRSMSPNLNTFYYFFDYDAQDASSPFKPGLQFFVSTAGLFAPASLVVLLIDDSLVFHETRFTFPSAMLINDDTWFHVMLQFDRSLALPTCEVNAAAVAGIKVFGSDLNQLGPISPVNGIRFAMREFSESVIGRSNLQMAAAAYAKDLAYVWPYWGI